MDDARAAGVPVGVLTNHAYAILGRDVVRQPAGVRIARHVHRRRRDRLPKPDPQAYLLAAEELGVRPEDVVFLDDTPECVDGARAVGMTAHRGRPGRPPPGVRRGAPAARPRVTAERVVITGANRGLGLELARVYAERGDEVVGRVSSPGRRGRAA